MHPLVEDLIQVMGELERLYEALGVLLGHEPQAILARDMEALANSTAEKERLLSRLAAFGSEQERLRQQIIREYQLPGTSNLTQMAERLPQPCRDELHRAGDRLRAAIHRVQRLNGQSRLLVQHCLAMVQNALTFLTRWSAPTMVYAASGRIGSGPPGGRLVSSTI